MRRSLRARYSGRRPSGAGETILIEIVLNIIRCDGSSRVAQVVESDRSVGMSFSTSRCPITSEKMSNGRVDCTCGGSMMNTG